MKQQIARPAAAGDNINQNQYCKAQSITLFAYSLRPLRAKQMTKY
jgi:hypothetical protein